DGRSLAHPARRIKSPRAEAAEGGVTDGYGALDRPASYAACVDCAGIKALPAYPARRPCRRRGREPPAARARRLRPSAPGGRVEFSPPGLACPREGRADRPRGDEHDRRPGVALSCPHSRGALA